MTPESRKRFAIALHTARINRGLSVIELAKDLGISRTTYGHYESGNSEPSLSLGLQICNKLSIDPWMLVELVDQRYEIIRKAFDSQTNEADRLIKENSELWGTLQSIADESSDEKSRWLAKKTLNDLLGFERHNQ